MKFQVFLACFLMDWDWSLDHPKGLSLSSEASKFTGLEKDSRQFLLDNSQVRSILCLHQPCARSHACLTLRGSVRVKSGERAAGSGGPISGAAAAAPSPPFPLGASSGPRAYGSAQLPGRGLRRTPLGGLARLPRVSGPAGVVGGMTILSPTSGRRASPWLHTANCTPVILNPNPGATMVPG